MQLVELLRGYKSEANEKVWTQLSQVLLPLDRVIVRLLSPPPPCLILVPPKDSAPPLNRIG